MDLTSARVAPMLWGATAVVGFGLFVAVATRKVLALDAANEALAAEVRRQRESSAERLIAADQRLREAEKRLATIEAKTEGVGWYGLGWLVRGMPGVAELEARAYRGPTAALCTVKGDFQTHGDMPDKVQMRLEDRRGKPVKTLVVELSDADTFSLDVSAPCEDLASIIVIPMWMSW